MQPAVCNVYKGIPTNVQADLAEAEDCVIIRWVAPENEEVDGFYIEYCEADTDFNWRRVTVEPIQSTDPYPVMGLPHGKYLK